MKGSIIVLFNDSPNFIKAPSYTTVHLCCLTAALLSLMPELQSFSLLSFLLVNSVALHGDGCPICQSVEKELIKLSRDLNCSLQVGRSLCKSVAHLHTVSTSDTLGCCCSSLRSVNNLSQYGGRKHLKQVFCPFFFLFFFLFFSQMQCFKGTLKWRAIANWRM